MPNCKTELSPPMRGVIYARYSSSGQREESIEGQLRECRRYAKVNGITIVGEYVDKALTGRTDKRPDFQRMLRDSERGIFDVVITWKIDRFARNRYDSAMYKYRLKKNGVRIFYAKESIPDGPEGIILESVMEGYAEYYSESLSQNVKRGNYDSALERKTIGATCYGLTTGPDGRYQIVPEEAAIVRRMFEEYAAGEKMLTIYRRLNSEGFRTRRGGLFNKGSCRRILSNKKYAGIYEYADIYDEQGIPAIVDKALFDKVQKMLDLNHRAPSRSNQSGGFLLTTKLFCGLCGAPMTGDGGTSRSGKVYDYYTCNNRKYKRTCKKERAKKDWIEELIVRALVELIHSDTFIATVADKVMEYQEREKDRSALTALEIRQKEIQKAIDNLLSAIEAGIITPSTKSRLVALESEKADVEHGIAKEFLQEPDVSREQVVFFLEHLRDGDMSDEAYRIQLVDTFLNSVYLYDDKFILVLNYSGENCKITLPILEKALQSQDSISSSVALSGAPNPRFTNCEPWVFCCNKNRLSMKKAEQVQ